MLFEDLPLSEDILDALYDMHFETCSPVQAECIPHLLENKDLLGIAQTGTGKTAAYLLPILTLLQQEEHPKDAVNCLIMAPTRELARQIDQAMQGFAFYMNISSVAIYGGNDGIRYEQERKSLLNGADIVIATPGRLITHLQLGTLDLSKTSHFILDEADRMLDMGFADDIKTIVEQLPKERQTILFSATMPTQIRTLAKQIMRNPVEVNIAISKPAEKIEQYIYQCKNEDKVRLVANILGNETPERIILFSSSKQKVKDIYNILLKKGFNIVAMHSDLEQPERDKTMQQFKARQKDILVATDIVARGIDIDDIKLVVNIDIPNDAEDYIHRIGRAGRAGKSGKAVTFVSEKDLPKLQQIEKLLGEKIEKLELPVGFTEPDFTKKKIHNHKQKSGNNKPSQKTHHKKHYKKSHSQPKATPQNS